MKITEAKYLKCFGCRAPAGPTQEKCTKCGDRLLPWPVKPVVDQAVDSAPYRMTTTLEKVRPLPMETTNTTRTAGPDASAHRVTPALEPGTPPRPDRALSDPRSDVGIALTEQQLAAVAAVDAWFRGGGNYAPFRLFGPAGTGKTTIVKSIAQVLGVHAVFGAYTGKAASVLVRKGVHATTIHSAIYTPAGVGHKMREREELLHELAELQLEQGPPSADPGRIDAIPVEVAALDAEIAKGSGFRFNPDSEWAYADLIVLDEVSMVGRAMADDIESFGVPVLVLGDPAQLPPIDGGGHYTAAEPDFLLTEIHRQALDSPVLALATRIRLGESWAAERVRVNLDDAMAADQILVWKNSTRWNLIEKIRAKRGRPAGRPAPGDHIMCLANNRDAGLFNGQQFTVTSVVADDIGWTIEALDDQGHPRRLQAFPHGFRGLEDEQAAKKDLRAWKGPRGLFTFADAITVHKAQGSEWDTVYVVDQTGQMTRSLGAEKRAWMYTAVTRASQKVTIAVAGAGR